MDYKVVIWGADDSNVLGVLRAFKNEISSVFTLFQGKKNYIASVSNYCKKHAYVKAYEEGIDLLVKIGESCRNKPFLITTTDLVAEIVDEHRKDLIDYYYLSGTLDHGGLARILDKYYMGKIAQKNGFIIPQTQSITSNSETNHINYPCLIKPNKNCFDHTKEFKTRICNNENELKRVLRNVGRDSKFVLQDYIEKDYDLLVYGCRLYSGEVVFAGCFKKDRWYKQADGSHGYIEPVIPSCVKTSNIEAFLSDITYYGLFSFEFGVKNDVAYFYEVNLRNDGTSHYFLQAGANIPLIWVLQHEDQNVLKYNELHLCEFIDEVYDDLNVEEGIVSKNLWREQRRSSSVFRYYDKEDKMPYYFQVLLKRLKQFFKPIKPLLLFCLNSRR